MSDLSELQAAQTVKMAGADPAGSETNYLGVTSNHEVCNVDTQNGSLLSTVVTVGTTEIELKVGGSALANRKELYIENVGNRTAWVGPTGVSDSGLSLGRKLERTIQCNYHSALVSRFLQLLQQERQIFLSRRVASGY